MLDLRRDPELAREIAARVVEEYAVMLNKRNLPITPVLYILPISSDPGHHWRFYPAPVYGR